MHPMSRSITISPIGGLANRMRALLSARALANDAEAELSVLWSVSSELGCEPQLLWDVSAWNWEWRTVSSLANRLIYNPPGKGNLYLPLLVHKLRGRHSLNITTAVNKEELLSLAHSHDLFITSGLAFYPYDTADVRRIFTPTPEISAMVDAKLAPMAGHPKAGVHIRRTDNKQSILHSPDELFIEAMRKMSDDTMFYLATDSQEVKEKFRALFPGRIICSDAPACRSSREGIIEAWAEMLALSRMDCILGSFYSSFSEMAAMIGSIPLKTLTLS